MNEEAEILKSKRQGIVKANADIRKRNESIRQNIKLLERQLENNRNQLTINAEIIRDNQMQFEAAGKELRKLLNT